MAYENRLPNGHTFGVYLSLPYEHKRGPWFIRDYGMAMHNPTWIADIETKQGESWSVSLRVVAYDDALTSARAEVWQTLSIKLSDD